MLPVLSILRKCLVQIIGVSKSPKAPLVYDIYLKSRTHGDWVIQHRYSALRDFREQFLQALCGARTGKERREYRKFLKSYTPCPRKHYLRSREHPDVVEERIHVLSECLRGMVALISTPYLAAEVNEAHVLSILKDLFQIPDQGSLMPPNCARQFQIHSRSLLYSIQEDNQMNMMHLEDVYDRSLRF